jgi:PLP dependent protein
VNAAEVAERVAIIRQRIVDAGGVNVELVAVTKTFDETSWRAARDAGVDGIGENYAQELAAKAQQTPADLRPTVHFIGQLQSNKVKIISEIVDVWQSVDRISIIDEILRRTPDKPPRMFVQVNTTKEAGKGGCEPETVAAVVNHAVRNGAAVEGLMTVGPTDGDPTQTRAAFRMLRSLAHDLGLRGLSMGMTNDLEIAVEEGSTLVRVGSAIFGTRTGA